MGEDVKIDDLARKLIQLAGFEPGKEIKIVYTGLRPGEKLVEELRLQAEGLAPTAHEKIRVLQGGKVDFLEVRGWLDELSTLVESRNVHGLVKTLISLVPEYSPSEEILALCDVDRHDSILRYRRGQGKPGSSFQRRSSVIPLGHKAQKSLPKQNSIPLARYSIDKRSSSDN